MPRWPPRLLALMAAARQPMLPSSLLKQGPQLKGGKERIS
jgi:hypothetical protein